MEEHLHLPIALRRTPRRSLPSDKPVEAAVRDGAAAVARTPSQRAVASKKRVRFSDPGPDVTSTGLTPMVRRTWLGVTPSPKRKRPSALARAAGGGGGGEDEIFGAPGRGTEVRVLSMRQILDDRVKRRIRRNGLSEEMNAIEEEKKQGARAERAEIDRLRRELADRDDEIDRLRDTTVFQDTDRLVELEQQIEQLRSELSSRAESAAAAQANRDWTLCDPFADDYMDEDGGGDGGVDEGFGDTTMRDLVCSTPTRVRTSFAASQSFPSPPSTSPTIPASPCFLRTLSPPPMSDAAAQVRLPDPEKETLEAELGSLRLELSKLNDTLENHEASRSRMADKLAGARGMKPSPDRADVEANVDAVLQSLADKTAALSEVGASLVNLGFAGRDASEVLASLVGEFRAARLELEYLTPGEVALPLHARGAAVLDLVLTRLRELSRKVREQDDTIEECHALERSLRQQLAARVQAMDGLKRDMQRELGRQAARLQEKDGRIAELELGVDRLKGAVEGYRRDAAALEEQLRRAGDAGREEAEGALPAQNNTQTALEEQLAAVAPQTADLRAQLAAIHTRRKLEIGALNSYHGRALAQRDARVADLRRELDAVHASLRQAHDTVCQLRVQNAALGGAREADKKAAADALAAMKAELERLLHATSRDGASAAPVAPPAPADEPVSSRRRSSARLLGAAPAPAPVEPSAGSFLAGGLTRRVSGKKRRRRHDSGLGLLGEEEVDL